MIPIVCEEGEYLILNKPAGILVHPPYIGYQEPTVVDYIVKYYPAIKTVGDDIRNRPGIVHRLDQAVSGVMVVASTQAMFTWLKRQFQERKVKKEYIALVYGKVVQDQGEISMPLKKDRGKSSVMPKGEKDGKRAITVFEVIRRFQHYTLMRVFLKTGRTHQIRAHLYGYNHSIAGDSKYCNKRYKNRSAFTKFIKSDRIFLHANRLEFYDMQGQWHKYSVDLPEELQKFIATLA